MNMAEKYPPSLVLTEIAENLDRHHRELCVTLPANYFTYKEGLSATLDCVGGLADPILLPTSNPARRQALRQQALENKDALSESKPFSSSRRIRTPGNLKPEDIPPPLPSSRRALLKHKFFDENEPPFREPHLIPPALCIERTLAAIVGNAKITAVDWEPGMPHCNVRNIEMLWDTGAATTIITKDLLDEQFQSHLSDPVHKDYQNPDGTRVQISFALEFTNSVFWMDLIAWVVDKEAIPNGRSGVILGQKGCIDALQYRSIPRSVLEAQRQTVDESIWGDLILESFVDLDGSLKEI
ncbi:uncharacterized protein BJX67DRAFT_342081 [Aspergillus lucknowensis]|uniref:Peptidase A2 domain-containing protein n=1 Tax=Aspergillus lucknowensis TaxID=176173 RepID=A0ABR4M438_9EURO